jgi:hypothetical protein
MGRFRYVPKTRAGIARAAAIAKRAERPVQTFRTPYRGQVVYWTDLAGACKARKEIDTYWAGRIAKAESAEERASILAEEWATKPGVSRPAAVKKVTVCAACRRRSDMLRAPRCEACPPRETNVQS